MPDDSLYEATYRLDELFRRHRRMFRSAEGTSSADFPTTPGALRTTFNAGGVGLTDGFATKLNSTGTAPVFSTYLGGGVRDLALDPSGNLYVTAGAGSDYPQVDPLFVYFHRRGQRRRRLRHGLDRLQQLPDGQWQPTFGGADEFGRPYDAFLLKLAAPAVNRAPIITVPLMPPAHSASIPP